VQVRGWIINKGGKKRGGTQEGRSAWGKEFNQKEDLAQKGRKIRRKVYLGFFKGREKRGSSTLVGEGGGWKSATSMDKGASRPTRGKEKLKGRIKRGPYDNLG